MFVLLLSNGPWLIVLNFIFFWASESLKQANEVGIENLKVGQPLMGKSRKILTKPSATNAHIIALRFE